MKLKISLVILALYALSFIGCREKVAIEETYQCPMHHTVISDKPGTCPVCGMDLVRQARRGEETDISEDLTPLLQSPNETVVSTVKTIRGHFRSQAISITTQGIVTYDTRNMYILPARIGGRLEQVFLKYAFQTVRKGQKVADIYSPELSAAQRELLYLIENDRNDQDLVESAKQKLFLLGATPAQVNKIIQDKKIMYTFSIYSPYDGYVIPAQQSTPPALLPDMNNTSQNAMTPTNVSVMTASTELIRSGAYVSQGQMLFKIVNTTALRVELSLPLAEAGTISAHDQIDLDKGNGLIQKAEVDFIQPFVTEGQQFVKLRVVVKQQDNLMIGQLVKATIHIKPSEGLWLPKQAVMDLGLNNVVFVKDRSVFKARTVMLGLHTKDSVQVQQGLASGEEVAREAHYLVDSESFVK